VKGRKGKSMPIEVGIIKDAILGKDYSLAFSFVSKKEIQKYNKMYRKKNKPTDVLSFSYSKKEGEILICKDIAKAKAKDFGMTAEKYLVFLFIHASLHLKGMLHGSTMEKQEAKWLKKFLSA
jgi:probable rRNA maturation factor